MKKLILIVAFMALSCGSAGAQKTTNDGRPRGVDTLPALPCSPQDFVQLKATPFTTSLCKNGAWTTVSTGASFGTVTSVSVVSANGLSGVVATATTTPAITLNITALDASKIGGGGVSTAEFDFLGTLTSDPQTQLNAKVSSVTGSANQITSSGGTAPVLSLPSAVILPGSLAVTTTSSLGAVSATSLNTHTIPAGTSTIALTSQLPLFNVKDCGAKGDSRKVTDAVLDGTTTVTSATATFTSADIGKVIYGIELASGIARLPVGTVQSQNSSSSIVVSNAATGGYSGITLVLGTDDSDAIRSCVTAAKAVNPKGVVYVPQGGYLFSKLLLDNRYGSLTDGVSVRGDGIAQTVFFLHPSYDLATTGTLKGLFHALTNGQNIALEGFTVDGLGVTVSGSGSYYGTQFGGRGHSLVRDVYVTRFVGMSGGARVDEMNHGYILGYKGDYNGSYNLVLNGVGVTVVDAFLSNGPARGLQINGIQGEGDTSYYVRWVGGLIDEHTVAESVLIQGASTDVTFVGAKIWAGTGIRAVNVTGTSKVKFFGCELTPYNNNANVTALKIDSTSAAYLSGTRLTGTGTGNAIDNAGAVYDLGGNVVTGNVTGTPRVAPPIPSMTTTQRDALAAAGGLVAGIPILNPTTGKLNFYTGSAWEAIASDLSLATIATSGSASDLSTGTIPDARFPATLPAISGVNLAALNAGNISSGILPTARGGTGIAFFTAAGPTVARVYTFPDAAATIARTDAAQTFTGLQTFGSADIPLLAPAGNIVEQRNGANGQTFNLYESYTDATHYTRGYMRMANDGEGLGTAFHIGTEHLNGSVRTLVLESSTPNGAIYFKPAGTPRFYMSNGFFAQTHNAIDIGASGANSPRTIYAGTSVIAPVLTASTSSSLGVASATSLTASTQFLADGAAATPAFAFTSQPNMGLRYNAANIMSFMVGSAERIRFQPGQIWITDNTGTLILGASGDTTISRNAAGAIQFGTTAANALGSILATNATLSGAVSTPSIVTASGALGITPAAGSNLNVSLSTTGDFAVNTNQLYVDTSTGFVGISTASPQRNLHIVGADGATTLPSSLGVKDFLVVENNNAANIGIISGAASLGSLKFYPSGGTIATGSVAYDHNTNALTITTNAAARFTIASTGIFTLNTANYNTCSGLSTVAAVLTCLVSDERVKDGISPFKNALEVISKISPITFSFREGTAWYKGGRTELGLSAQNLKNASPLLASPTGNANSLLQPEPMALHALEIQGINELRARIEKLEARQP